MYFLGKEIVNEKKAEEEHFAAAVVKQEPADVAEEDKSKVKGDDVKTEPQESLAKVRVLTILANIA